MPKPQLSQLPRSFLLRCWQEQSPDDAAAMLWRFSLREVAEVPQEHGFGNLDQLIHFLLARLSEEETTR